MATANGVNLFMKSIGSAMGRKVAMQTVQSQIEQRVAAATTPAAERIAWDDYNFPLKRVHPQLGWIHYDLAELATKKAAVYPLVLQLNRWCIFIIALLLVNFIDSIVLASIIKGAYTSVAPLEAFLCVASLGSTSFVVVHRWYHGACENSGRSKTIARALLVMLAFFFLLFALMPSGNINGIVGLAQKARLQHAEDAGTSAGAIAYWQAVIVLESLAFFAATGWSGYLIWRLFSDKT